MSHGLDSVQWLAVWRGQDMRCAICRVPVPHSGKGVDRDHDHKTGRARGMLCRSCNARLSDRRCVRSGWASDPRVQAYLQQDLMAVMRRGYLVAFAAFDKELFGDTLHHDQT